MIVVAPVAVALWLVDRRSRFLQLAERYKYKGSSQPVQEDGNSSIRCLEDAAGIRPYTDSDRRLDSWCDAMYRKYECAASNPWLPVPPDPGPPKPE